MLWVLIILHFWILSVINHNSIRIKKKQIDCCIHGISASESRIKKNNKKQGIHFFCEDTNQATNMQWIKPVEVELFWGGGQKPLRNLLVSEAMFFLATFSPSGTALNFLLCTRPAAYVRMFWKALSQTSSWNVWKVAPQHLAVDSEQEVGRPLKRSRWEVCFGCLIIRTRWGGLQKNKKKKSWWSTFPNNGIIYGFFRTTYCEH